MSSSNSQSSFTPVSLQSVAVANRSQNSKIVANNFTKIDDRSYQCNICKYVGKQQQKAGHGNLVKHLTAHHPDVFERPIEVMNGAIDQFVSKKSNIVYD